MNTPYVQNQSFMNTRIIYLLSILFFAFQYIFYNDTQGALVLGGLAAFLLIYSILTGSIKSLIKIDSYHKHLIVFALYCLASVWWAYDADLALGRALTMIKILIIMFVIYPVFRDAFNYKQLFSIMMWGGFVVMIYTIIVVGIENLILLSATSGRLENDDFINVNVLGQLATYVVLINVFFQIYDKLSWNILINIPSLLIIALCGSRKAFVLLIVGLFVLFVLKNQTQNKIFYVFKITLTSIIIIILLNTIMSIPIFGVINERMEGLIAAFTGVGEVDHSTLVRESMREIGYNQFLKTPILGIGIDNARILSYQNFGKLIYLHCNYAELAADLGVIGLLLFYRMHLYVGYNLWKVSIKEHPYNALVIMMVIFMLVSDYGVVSYYYKDFFMSIMIIYIYIEHLNPKTVFSIKKRFNYRKLRFSVGKVDDKRC